MPDRSANDANDASAVSDVGVVALAMGGPARPEEVQPFLEALFADPDLIRVPVGPLRRPFAWLVSRLRASAARRRYALIGGSPLVTETRAQVAALSAALAPDALPVRLALAYGAPDLVADAGAGAALRELADLGVQRVLALPLYPQRSGTTSGASLRSLRRATEDPALPTLSIEEVPPYPTLPGLVGPLAYGARQALGRAAEAGHRAAVIATAHGIPERYVRDGDPYVEQVEQTFEAFRQALAEAPHAERSNIGERSRDGERPNIVEAPDRTGRSATPGGPARAPDGPVVLGYQSRIGPVRWVGPQVEDVVARLAAEGVTALTVVPLTFVCEHLETRYDLDLALKATAWEAGIHHYERVPAVGTHPAFIAGLADQVRAAR
jgi:ferrochelatase